MVQKPRTIGVMSAANSIAGDDEEESIEQYMAKLLQRVRGDSAPAPASQAAPQPSGPLGYEPELISPTMSLSAISLRDAMTVQPGDGDGSQPEFIGRKPSMPAPQTDLEALRALANESARRAISRHAVRKHRRKAGTKVIVSALAAMTSVWLMLESPTWVHPLFITACVSTLVAAYWAGETIRALRKSSHMAAPDETEEEIKEIAAELQARLPIDVVN
jgi:hypothetical protein